jgi:hypothetical protein
MIRPDTPRNRPEDLLGRISMTEDDRLRAQAEMLRGEYLAELMLRGISALRGLARHFEHRPKAPQHLKSAN